MSEQVKRGPGRPPRGQAAITEANYPDIYQRWLRGASVHSLAAEYGCQWHAMNFHLQKCRTMLKTVLLRERNEVLDEVYALKNRCYRGLEKSERPLTHDEVSKELDRAAADKGSGDELVSRVVRQTTKMTIRDGDASWVEAITRLIDLECKLTGLYEVGKREGQKPPAKGTFRAAGRSPKATHEAMAQRLLEVLGQRGLALPQARPTQSAVGNSTVSDVVSSETPARLGMPLTPPVNRN